MDDASQISADANRVGSSALVRRPLALQHTWWINVYPDGAITDGLCRSAEAARDRCTWSNDPLRPNAEQVEVQIVPAAEYAHLVGMYPAALRFAAVAVMMMRRHAMLMPDEAEMWEAACGELNRACTPNNKVSDAD